MKFGADFSYPHPVLGMPSVTKDDLFIRLDTDLEIGEHEYEINITIEHNNPKLNKLVEEGNVEYVCEVNCSDTFLRKLFPSSENGFKISIGRKHVKGKVDCICYAVAKKSIDNYKNESFLDEFSDFVFNLDGGDILAYFGEFTFDADIHYNKVKAISSFMEVVENPSIEISNIVLSNSKITVELPSEQYKVFASNTISRDPKYAAIFHSSIVNNALLVALYDIKKYEDCAWAKTILYRLKNEDAFNLYSIEEATHIPTIAAILLGNPTKRLLETLSTLKSDLNSIE